MLLHRGEEMVWPMRLYLLAIGNSSHKPMRRCYPGRRTSASWREQFLVSWFMWFFALFLLMIMFGGGSPV